MSELGNERISILLAADLKKMDFGMELAGSAT
jgi:hypothetical protein